MGRPDDEDVEFADQAPSDSDEQVVESEAAEDSDMDYAAEAPEQQDVYEAQWSSSEDSGGFADDAGTDASYGFESATDTSRFRRDSADTAQVEQELADDLGDSDDAYAPDPALVEGGEELETLREAESVSPDEGLYPVEGTAVEGEATGFAEVADEATEEEAYDEAAQDDVTEVAGFGAVEDVPAEELEEAPVEEAPVEEAPVEEAPVEEAAAEEEEESARDRGDAGSRSGQVSKDALDAIFARAAEIKRPK